MERSPLGFAPRVPRDHQVRTKTVATVGPACEASEMLEQLARSGVDVFRINMAHGGRAFHETMVGRIRAVGERIGRPIAILIDLAGPKIRLGELGEGPRLCAVGREFSFTAGERSSDATELVTTFTSLIDDLAVGNLVVFADGAVAMEVIAKAGGRVALRVVSGGEVRSRQGINVPNAKLSVAAGAAEDEENVTWACSREIDFVGLSFVRESADVLALRDRLRAGGSNAMIIAKIEKRESLVALDEIVAAADAVMVARGDLGVEIDIAETPAAQKRIIAACRRHLKPVIVATQMLDSMQSSIRPTRAEVTDVANAILDGADACMLSGETAIGKYPLETVGMMNRIMAAAEQMLRDTAPEPPPVAALAGVHPITAAVTYGAGRIASQLSASLVVVATRSGNTARVKSKQRDFIPTVGVSDSEAVLRRMCLFWGIIPLRGAPINHGPQLRAFIEAWGIAEGVLRSGDRTVFVTGTDLVPTAHNLVAVHETP